MKRIIGIAISALLVLAILSMVPSESYQKSKSSVSKTSYASVVPAKPPSKPPRD